MCGRTLPRTYRAGLKGVIMKRRTTSRLVGAVHFLASPPPVPCAPCDGICDYIVGDAHLPRVRAQQWTECSELGAQSMHANGGHDQLDGLRLNACIAWGSCQCKIWTELSSTGPWPSATCTGHAGSSFLGHVNTYHRTSPCALSCGAPRACQIHWFVSRLISCAAAGC